MATACAWMVTTSWPTTDSEMQQRWCAKNEECEPFINQAVDRGVGLVGGGVFTELPHEHHSVGGEGASGLGDEEVDRAALLEGVVVVAAALVDAPDARGAVEAGFSF